MAGVSDEAMKNETKKEEQYAGEAEDTVETQIKNDTDPTTSEQDAENGNEPEVLDKHEEEVKELEEEIAKLNNQFIRVQADYDNFRKRTKAEKEAAAKYRSQSLAEQLLPVLDNFERALEVETSTDESKSILKGVEMVYRQLVDALQQEGIEEIEAMGAPFDPHYHQAVMQEKSEEHDSGIVIDVLQKGYNLKERVIRPAMVKVSE